MWTARIACGEKGVTYELDPFERFEVRGSEHRKLHPWTRMPVMMRDDFVLYETAAIVRYIDAAFDGPPLQPESPHARALQDQWISAFCAYIDHDIIRKWLLPLVLGDLEDERVQARIAAGKAATGAHLAALEAAYDGREFLVGDRFSLADAFVAPVMSYLSMQPEGRDLLAAHPGVARALEVMRSRPSFRDSTPAMPKREAFVGRV